MAAKILNTFCPENLADICIGATGGMTTNLGLFLPWLQQLAPISIQSSQIDSHFLNGITNFNQKTQQSYDFKGISLGSSNENISSQLMVWSFKVRVLPKEKRWNFRNWNQLYILLSFLSAECICILTPELKAMKNYWYNVAPKVENVTEFLLGDLGMSFHKWTCVTFFVA